MTRTKLRFFFNQISRRNREAKSNYLRFDSSELDSGIKLCVSKAKRLVSAARLLALDERFLPYALGLYVFALEEYGKSRLLQKERISSSSSHLVHMKIFGFGDRNSHKKKIKEGSKNLPTKTIKVETEIVLKQNASDKTRTFSLKDDKINVSIGGGLTGSFSAEGDIDILEDVRWRSFYLDWDNEQRYWKNELRPKKTELLQLLADLENCLY